MKIPFTDIHVYRSSPDGQARTSTPHVRDQAAAQSAQPGTGVNVAGYLGNRDKSMRARVLLDMPGGFQVTSNLRSAQARQSTAGLADVAAHPQAASTVEPTPPHLGMPLAQRIHSWMQQAQQAMSPTTDLAAPANPVAENGLLGAAGQLAGMIGGSSIGRQVGQAFMQRARGVVENLAMHAAYRGRYNDHLPDLVDVGRHAYEMHKHEVDVRNGASAHWAAWGGSVAQAHMALNRLPVSHRLTDHPLPEPDLLQFLAEWPPMTAVMQARYDPPARYGFFPGSYQPPTQGQGVNYRELGTQDRQELIKMQLGIGAGSVAS